MTDEFEIKYNRSTKDFDVTAHGEFIGSAPTYVDGEKVIQEYRSEHYYKALQMQGCADASAVTD